MKTNAQGMVVVKVQKPFEMWFPGMLCGFYPSKAKDLIDQGFAKLPDEPSVAPDAPVSHGGEIEIPADWRDQHHLANIALARRIAGDAAPASMLKQDAETIIETEIARRAAAE